ncbi:MAG: ABC transporter permease subunit [Dongiaceae bacterium]
MAGLRAKLAAAGLVAGALALVELAVRAGLVDSFLLPPPSAVLASLPRLLAEEALAPRLARTAGEVLAGAAAAILLGCLAGAAMHRRPVLRAAFAGWVVGFAAAPLILVYPLLLILLGRSLAMVVAMSALAALPPILLRTVEGLDGTRPVLLAVGRSFALTPAQLFWRVRVPAALPAIMGGIRLGLVYALIGVISVEYLTGLGGLGELITDLSDRYDMAAMYGAILFVMLVSAGLLAAAERLERWLRPA